MRPLTQTVTGVLATAALVLTPVLAGSASAASPHAGGSASSHGRPAPVKPVKPVKPVPSRAKAKVVVVGVVTAAATQTVTAGATSTVVVSITVQGGSDKDYRRGATVKVTVTKDTVVKRNNGRKTRYELRVGDKVTVHARRAAGGALTATYVAAGGRPVPVQTVPSATGTATTTATTHRRD